MSNILFMDDSKERLRTFRSLVPSATLVETAEQCIELLKKEHFTLASLDHDLGGEILCNSDREDTGMGVVRWIIANSPKIETVVVHTLNFEAGKLMVAKLRDAGYDALYCSWLDIASGKVKFD